ncbi:MAG: small multi-drug export protein [Clostridia bacterium]|nr:small multi-drug export protein [Clostridia bacterium]
MTQAISDFFLETVGKELCVLFCSMIPVIELRGAIPLGAVFGLPWWKTYLLAVAGNMIPVPFILLFIRFIIDKMAASRIGLFNKTAGWLNRKAEKNRPKIEKYAFWGMALFVAIPLPVTGAWCGSLVCATIGEKFWKAVLSAFIGVTIAATIMTLASYGAAEALKFLI